MASGHTNNGQQWRVESFANDGTADSERAFASVQLVDRFVATEIAAGFGFACALDAQGQMRCWGDNRKGELGQQAGTPMQQCYGGSCNGFPQFVSATSNTVLRLGDGFGTDHGCVVTSGNKVQCWGDDRYGQLGDTSFGHGAALPTTATGYSGSASAVAAGHIHSCALGTDGGLDCWGGNGFGALGSGASSGPEFCSNPSPPGGTGSCTDTALAVSGLASGVSEIQVGSTYGCARATAGGIKCWGYNAYGSLGDGNGGGSGDMSASPVDVSGLTTNMIQVSTGNNFACGLRNDGKLFCWGLNAYGSLGIGNDAGPDSCYYDSTRNHACAVAPQEVTTITPAVSQVAAGGGFACALLSDGDVRCWGRNLSGAIGSQENNDSCLSPVTGNNEHCVLTPRSIAGLQGTTVSVVAGSSFACALNSDGVVQCWGLNQERQLGSGGINNSYTTPQTVFGTQ